MTDQQSSQGQPINGLQAAPPRANLPATGRTKGAQRQDGPRPEGGQGSDLHETETVRGVFDNTARTYDFLNHLFSFNIDSKWRERLVARSESAPGSRVLDVCCGTGDVAITFARRVPDSRITAVDFSPVMLDHARTKVDARGLTGAIEVRNADALNLPFEAASFDAVSNSFGIRTLADRPRAVAEMARVTRTGGRVLIMEFLPPPPTLFGRVYGWYLDSFMPFLGGLLSGFRASYSYLSDTVAEFPSPEEVTAMMRNAGLTAIGSEQLTHGIAHLFWGTKGESTNEDHAVTGGVE